MTINIADYTAIVADFERFLDFCTELPPKLTKSKEYINRQALHELNQDLKMPAVDVNPRNDQHLYLPIHFYYSLALEADLCKVDRTRKNAFYLVPNPDKIAVYNALSTNSQYLFLLKTYWINCDWQNMVGNDRAQIFEYEVDEIIVSLSTTEIDRTYTRKDEDNELVRSMNWSVHEHVMYWELLGWLRLKRNTTSSSKSFFRYEEIKVSKLGHTITNILQKDRPFTEWNIRYVENGPSIFDYAKMSLVEENEQEEKLDLGLSSLPENPTPEQIMQRINLVSQQAREELGVGLDLAHFLKQAAQKGKQPSLEELMRHIVEKMEDQSPETIKKPTFESAFADLFPNETIPKLLVKPEPIFNDGQYILKVGLLYEPKIWRKVALNGEDTLLDLHQIIQKAFKFDDDHLYAFYMDKRRNRSINDPRGGDPPFVDDFQLGDLNLTINQRFFYLFDFGDSWEFTIDLLEIQEVDKKLKTPKIIEKKGEAPPQYGYYDEDDDFDKWE